MVTENAFIHLVCIKNHMDLLNTWKAWHHATYEKPYFVAVCQSLYIKVKVLEPKFNTIFKFRIIVTLTLGYGVTQVFMQCHVIMKDTKHGCGCVRIVNVVLPQPWCFITIFLRTAMPRVSSRWMAAPLLLTAKFLRADILMSIWSVSLSMQSLL